MAFVIDRSLYLSPEVVGEPGPKGPLVEDPASLDGLEAFWAGKPENEAYQWFNTRTCAFGQWRDHVDSRQSYVTLLVAAGIEEPVDFENEVAAQYPHTFGAALTRLKEYRARKLLAEREK